MALGEFSFYNVDSKVFAKEIADRFKVNIELGVSNYSDLELSTPVTDLLDFGYKETYPLCINLFDYDEENIAIENIYNSYVLTIPVKMPYEKELNLEFFPNNIFLLSYLTFNHTWGFFIGDLNGKNDHCFTSHQVIIDEINKTKKAYYNLLSKIDCYKILIYTDAQYNFEDKILYNQQKGKKLTFEETVLLAQKLDNVKPYSFNEVLKGKVHPDFPKTFLHTNDLDIVLIDNLSFLS